jgi:hypothetical protein
LKKSFLLDKSQFITSLSDESASKSLSHIINQLFAAGILDLKRLEKLRQNLETKQRAEELFHVLETSQHPLAFVEFNRLFSKDSNRPGKFHEPQVSRPHPEKAKVQSSAAAVSRNALQQRPASPPSAAKRHLANAQTQTDAAPDDVSLGRRSSSPKQLDDRRETETTDVDKGTADELCVNEQQKHDDTRVSDEHVPSSRSESPKSTATEAKCETATAPTDGNVHNCLLICESRKSRKLAPISAVHSQEANYSMRHMQMKLAKQQAECQLMH